MRHTSPPGAAGLEEIQNIDAVPTKPGDASDPRDPIVIVDDDPLLCRTMEANLADAGLPATACQGGKAALRYFADGGRASAVLLDWQMPDIDGPEVLRQLRAAGREVPVIFLTGHNQPIFEEAALAGGAVDFVEKSKSFSIILRRLKLALTSAKGESVSPPIAIEVPGITFEADGGRASWLGKLLELTALELDVVKLLVAKVGRDVSYREIYDLLRNQGVRIGSPSDDYRAKVRTIIQGLRRKFRDVDDSFDRIGNYSGFGYRWSNRDSI